MTILLITYPVSPYRGSEYSVSWNFKTNMSKYHELYVLYGTSGNGLGNVDELKRYISPLIKDRSPFPFECFWKYADSDMPEYIEKIKARIEQLEK